MKVRKKDSFCWFLLNVEKVVIIYFIRGKQYTLEFAVMLETYMSSELALYQISRNHV